MFIYKIENMKISLNFFIFILVFSGTACKKSSKSPITALENVQDAAIDIQILTQNLTHP